MKNNIVIANDVEDLAILSHISAYCKDQIGCSACLFLDKELDKCIALFGQAYPEYWIIKMKE